MVWAIITVWPVSCLIVGRFSLDSQVFLFFLLLVRFTAFMDYSNQYSMASSPIRVTVFQPIATVLLAPVVATK